MKNNPCGKDIASYIDCLIPLHINDLRSNIARSATSIEQIGLILADSRKPEVNDHRLKRILASEHDILHFYVTMHHTTTMHTLQTLSYTQHYLLHLAQLETLSCIQPLEQRSSFQQICDDIQGRFRLVNAVNFQYISMFESPQKRNFIKSTFLPFRFLLEKTF